MATTSMVLKFVEGLVLFHAVKIIGLHGSGSCYNCIWKATSMLLLLDASVFNQTLNLHW
uniref:Uncharacterized protein n=1 Tax=Anguilla anguilla TaxID=7936 RepID=A0A0E9UA75_ANGAN